MNATQRFPAHRIMRPLKPQILAARLTKNSCFRKPSAHLPQTKFVHWNLTQILCTNRKFCSSDSHTLPKPDYTFEELNKINEDLDLVTNYTEVRVILQRLETIISEKFLTKKFSGQKDPRLVQNYLFEVYKKLDRILSEDFRNLGSNDIVRVLEV
jgi:hypothetical protein